MNDIEKRARELARQEIWAALHDASGHADEQANIWEEIGDEPVTKADMFRMFSKFFGQMRDSLEEMAKQEGDTIDDQERPTQHAIGEVAQMNYLDLLDRILRDVAADLSARAKAAIQRRPFLKSDESSDPQGPKRGE
jgi:hypothetical protein